MVALAERHLLELQDAGRRPGITPIEMTTVANDTTLFTHAEDRKGGLAHADPRLGEPALRRALELGVSFLRRRQGQNGVWKGFRLPPGPATSWLTAHVAWVCESVPGLDGACRSAAAHLERVGPDDGGWGFNRRVGIDTRSTALALLVLHRFRRPVPDFLLAELLRAQLPGGGFATYAPGAGATSGWHAAHPDVTIVAVEALRRYGLGEPERRALAWLEGEAPRTGVASYWWQGPEYGLWLRAKVGVLRDARTADAVTAALAEARPVPQSAQLLAAAVGLGLGEERPAEASAAHLVRTQLADGSWPCAPCLRVTDPREAETRPQLRGRVYGDARRIFSTAHGVAALQALADRRTGGRASASLSIPAETG